MMFKFFFDTERNPHSRVFKKGDIKYVILDLLREKPRHGYEIIRALEERFRGFYSPSAGSVYPTLQLLEDMGYVTSTVTDGKKIYSITDEGKNFLKEREETVEEIRGRVRDWWGPGADFPPPPLDGDPDLWGWWGPGFGKEFNETFQEWGDIARIIGRRARRMDHDKMSRIKDIIMQARRDIEKVIGEEK
jgi:DNA-binding PadR family transcriptional regulator